LHDGAIVPEKRLIFQTLAKAGVRAVETAFASAIPCCYKDMSTPRENIMLRRIYYMLPNVPAARAMLDELLLARIEERRMHFLAREGTLPPDMPDANFLQKTDVVHGAQIGTVIGGACGLVSGTLLVLFPPEGLAVQTMAVLVAGLGGALFGAWASGLNAAANPNSRLAAFADRIARGEVLLILDLPVWRVQEIEDLIKSRHPDFGFGGQEPSVPAFP
jgi:hypothetical protein